MDLPEAPAPRPLSFDPAHHADGALSLPHWGLMRARGKDAASFLHGQLSNDFLRLAPGQVRLAGFCSAKGRLQASFFGWKLADDELLLACHASLLPGTLKRLGMFVLRSQCRLSDAGQPAAPVGDAAAGAALVCTGLLGATARRALAAAGMVGDGDAPAWQQRSIEGGSLLVLPPVQGQVRAVWVAPAGQAAPGLPPEAALPAQALALAQWCWLEVQSGVPVIEAATVDQFVPQMLNYELIGGVDFQKGCYPGQEVVARSQYRGTVKRRMFLFDSDGLAVAGQEVFHPGDPAQPAGMVVNAAPRGQGAGSSALVEVKLAALDGARLHLGSIGGPGLEQRALPYPVAAEAEAEG